MVKHLIQWVVCLCLCATGINTAWADTKTFDFSFSTIGSTGWNNGYATDHTVTYPEGIVTFVKAAKQTQTIKDVPVFRDPDTGIILVMKDGKTLNGFTLNCRQWNTNTNTVILSTSTDGETFTEHSSKEIKANDLQFSVSNLQNVKAIKLLLKSKKQVGFESIDITYGTSNAKTVNIKSFTADKDQINVFETVKTTVENNQPEWTPAYTYKSLKETVATVNGNGDITGVAKGKAQIVVSANTSNDANYTSGKKDTLEITVEDNRALVNLTGFTATETTLTKDETTTTTVSNNQSGWTANYTYSSNKESVATVDENGKITAVAKGKATITVTAVVDADDRGYKAGETLTKSVDIEVVNPKHTVTFLANGKRVSSEEMEEGSAITFTDLEAQYIPEGQTFMGWAAAAFDGTQENAPALVKSATVGTTDVTYYAVFATASTSGNANWVRKTVSEVVANPEAGDYALITPDGHAFNGTVNKDGDGNSTEDAFDFNTSNEATSAPEGTCVLKITAKSNGIEIAIKDGGKVITASKASRGGFALSDNSEGYYWELSSNDLIYSKKYNTNNAHLRSYSNTFRTYSNATNNGIAFAYRSSVTYTNYCTTVGGADTREFVKFTAWNTNNGETTLEKGNTLATVATLNPAECATGTITYTSSNPEVATIAADGVITAVGKGEATLVATLSIEEDDKYYRLSQENKQTLTINVVNPEHTVTFMADGEPVEEKNVREEEAFSFPAVTAPEGLVFIGWTEKGLKGMATEAPALVDTTAVVMGEYDLTFVAVYARVAQKGEIKQYELTKDLMREHFTINDNKVEQVWTDEAENVKWIACAVTSQGAYDDFLQIKSGAGYIGFETPHAIRNVSFNMKNGSNSDLLSGRFSIQTDVDNETEFMDVNVKGPDVSIDIEGNHSKLYMTYTGSNSARIRDIVLTCQDEDRYLGYVTNSKDANTARTHVVTIAASCDYTTVCLPYNAVAPEATLYALKSVDQNGLHFTSTDKLAAGQGYVLKGKAGAQYTLTEVLEAVDYNANLLKGVIENTNYEDLTLTGKDDYAYPWILAKDGSFKRYKGDYIPAGKAYLDGGLLQNLGESGAATMRVIFETTEEQQTGLDQLSNKANGSALYYNLQGQRIAQPQTGALYIEQSGRKLLLRK